MDPRTENSNTNQKQEQPSSSNSSVPPLSNVASIIQQQQGHGVEYDNTDDYYLGRLPKEYYASISKSNFFNPKGEKSLIDDDKDDSIIVISDTDNDDQRKDMIENQNPLPVYIISSESETESDDDDDDRNRQFYRGVAKRYASLIHTVPDHEDDDDVVHEIYDGSPTPFSETIKAIQERIFKTKKTGFVDESLIWVPKRNGEDLMNKRFCVPSLKELSLKVLANHADGMVSLDGIPDEFKQRLCALLCDSRKMNARFLQLLLSGFPTHIRLKDCSWLTQGEFITYFGVLDTSTLEVCPLNSIVSNI